MIPPRPDLPDVSGLGAGSLSLGALSVLSPFVTGRLFGSWPLAILLTGTILATASIWLAARTMRAPGGSPGRGMAGWGIALSILGVAFCLFGWVIQSTLNVDTL